MEGAHLLQGCQPPALSSNLPQISHSQIHHRHQSQQTPRGRAARAAGGGSAPGPQAPCRQVSNRQQRFERLLSGHVMLQLPCCSMTCRPSLTQHASIGAVGRDWPEIRQLDCQPCPAHRKSESVRRTNSAPPMERSARREACGSEAAAVPASSRWLKKRQLPCRAHQCPASSSVCLACSVSASDPAAKATHINALPLQQCLPCKLKTPNQRVCRSHQCPAPPAGPATVPATA